MSIRDRIKSVIKSHHDRTVDEAAGRAREHRRTDEERLDDVRRMADEDVEPRDWPEQGGGHPHRH
ncbi:hypothetical protein ACFQ2B_01965 [Streptomyces stramineus]|uniref:Antitoxin n=1 Tax=Streptomyces stramineus TaxID=173861 RepID=A0ABN1AKA3_9ACTN